MELCQVGDQVNLNQIHIGIQKPPTIHAIYIQINEFKTYV